MENLALLAVQAQNTISSGNTVLNATQAVLNQTRDFFVHGVLPNAGLDELDMFLLKKIGMLSHCGFENDMKITTGNVTDELLCAMRVHLMNESEVHVFCPKDARVWEDSCLNVEFMNYTAVSEVNELHVVTALRNSIYGLLASYPTTLEEDELILSNNDKMDDDDASTTASAPSLGPIMTAAVTLRLREKSILYSALDFLKDHEAAVRNGSVPFQLELKALERVQADLREAEHKKFVADIQARALYRPPLATIEVDMGADRPKANLTLEEGRDLSRTVQQFCLDHNVKANFVTTLQDALRARVKSPAPLLLMLGVVLDNNTGERKILAIPEGSNSTVETNVFCVRYGSTIDSDWCRALLRRVDKRLDTASSFTRRVLLIVPIDAPDSRKLQLVIREGEQHDIRQIVSDFFELYHMPMESVIMMANEVHKRLPPVVTQVTVDLPSQRSVAARFSMNDNITAVVEAFVNYYDLSEQGKIAILKRARYGMAPGTFMI